jgi:hypothetical protein
MLVMLMLRLGCVSLLIAQLHKCQEGHCTDVPVP